MTIMANYKQQVPVTKLCDAMSISRATLYRFAKPKTTPSAHASMMLASTHPRALTAREKESVLETLHSHRFIDASPQHVYATLLDEGRYLCSLRTMYRILAAQRESRERRAIVRHGNFQKPELLATGPNQVWSWDITKLRGPEKWTYFYLYVLLDIFSRYVVGWMVADRESGSYARALIEDSVEKQEVSQGQLVIHSDRGSPMKSKPVAFLLSDLGITKSFSRPHVSNDNPFSEAQFKTLKYCPEFPDRFGCKEDALFFCRRFLSWYNGEHKHSGIGYYTPEDVHYGRASDLEHQRNRTLKAAFIAHPERFVRKIPKAPVLPTAVWINPPIKSREEDINKNYSIAL